MVEIVPSGDYEIIITNRSDGDVVPDAHPVRDTFLTVRQVHGNQLYVVSAQDFPHRLSVEADAIICSRDLGIGIYVGDCLPLVLMGNQLYGVVHCGRKGLRSGIIENVAQYFFSHQQKPENLSYFIGPSIRTYEVGPEFAEYFPRRFLLPRKERYLFDVVGYVQQKLDLQGITPSQGMIHPACTFSDETYFSYRREVTTERNFVGVRRKT